jgi:[ribosomal protein S5]-alanine N-acetyltransferase
MDRQFLCETERVLLCRISDEDLEPLSRLLSDADVMEYSSLGPRSSEKAFDILEDMVVQQEKYGIGICSVINKETQEWMGFCGIFWKEDKGVVKTDLAYRLFKEFWGQGYASECVKVFLLTMTQQFPDVVVEAYVEPRHIASQRVAEKAGMKRIKKTEYHELPVYLYRMEKAL